MGQVQNFDDAYEQGFNDKVAQALADQTEKNRVTAPIVGGLKGLGVGALAGGGLGALLGAKTKKLFGGTRAGEGAIGGAVIGGHLGSLVGTVLGAYKAEKINNKIKEQRARQLEGLITDDKQAAYEQGFMDKLAQTADYALEGGFKGLGAGAGLGAVTGGLAGLEVTRNPKVALLAALLGALGAAPAGAGLGAMIGGTRGYMKRKYNEEHPIKAMLDRFRS